MRIILVACFCIVFIACTGNGNQPNQREAVSTVEGGNEADSLTQETDFIAYSSDAFMGAAVYVPVYSHIYQRNAQRTFNLTATLSFRNTDLNSTLTVNKVYYYDSEGNLVQKYLDSPMDVAPLSSVAFVVEEDDLRGGVGANFLVLWESEDSVSQPVVEAVMISAAQNQGISFVSEGRVIQSLEPAMR